MIKVTQLFPESSSANFVLIKILNKSFIVNKNNTSQRLEIKDVNKAYDSVYETTTNNCFAYCEHNTLFLFEGISDYHVIVLSNSHKIFFLLSDNIVYFYEIFSPIDNTVKTVNFIGSVKAKYVYFLFKTSFDDLLDTTNIDITKFASKALASIICSYSDSHYYIHPKYCEDIINFLSNHTNDFTCLFWIHAIEGKASQIITYELPPNTCMQCYKKAPYHFFKVPNLLINTYNGVSCDISILEEFAKTNEVFRKAFENISTYRFDSTPYGLTLIIDVAHDDINNTTDVVLFNLTYKRNVLCESTLHDSLPIIRTSVKKTYSLPNIFIEDEDSQKVYKVYYFSNNTNDVFSASSTEEPIVIRNPRKGIEYIFVKAKKWQNTNEEKDILLILTSSHKLIEAYENFSFENISETGKDFNSETEKNTKKSFILDVEGFFVVKVPEINSNSYLFISASKGIEIDYNHCFFTYEPCFDADKILLIVSQKDENNQFHKYVFYPQISYFSDFERTFNISLKKAIADGNYVEI